MTALTIDSGVDTVRDLAALLPDAVQARIGPELLTEPPSAAALRILATLRDQHWTSFVHPVRIGWGPMLEWARGRGASRSVRIRVELAASLAGCLDAAPDLRSAAYGLDQENFLAFLDALRIAREGLEP